MPVLYRSVERPAKVALLQCALFRSHSFEVAVQTSPALILAVVCMCLVALVIGLLVLIVAKHRGLTWTVSLAWGACTAAFFGTFFLTAGRSMGLLPA